MKENSFYQWMEFGEYSVKETYVEPKHGNIKQELLATGLIDIKLLNEKIIQKGNRYMKSKTIKAKKAWTVWVEVGSIDDPCHFGIANGAPLQPHHLYALLAYTDFTKLSSALTESHRKLNATETVEDVKARNEAFYWCSRFLRELTTYYGCHGSKQFKDKGNGYEKGPFFSGMSVVLALPQFTMGLQGPTSTSKQLAVAARFAGSQGMIIVLNNGSGMNQYEAFFDASWISQYPEEDERLFCGSMFRLEVKSLIIVSDRVNLKKVMSALFKMDAVLSGTVTSDGLTVGAKEVNTVRTAIKLLSGDVNGSVVKKEALSPFVLDMFYSYSINKTSVVMTCHRLDSSVGNKSFLNIFFFPIWKQNVDQLKENVNVYRPVTYELFPNLRQITIWTTFKGTDSVYPIAPQTLLNVIQSEKRPRTLRTIQIMDNSETKWSLKVFDEKVIMKYKAMNIGLGVGKTRAGHKMILTIPPASEQ